MPLYTHAKSSRNHVKLHHNILLLTMVIFLARDRKSLMLLYSAVEQLCAALSCREMGGAMCPIRRPCHNVYYQYHKHIPQGCQQPSVLAMVYGTKIKDHMNLILLPHFHHPIKNFQLHPRKYQHKERYQNIIINTSQNEGPYYSQLGKSGGMLLQENFNSQRVCLGPSDNGQYNVILGYTEVALEMSMYMWGEGHLSMSGVPKAMKTNWLDYFFYSQILYSIATVYSYMLCCTNERERHTLAA